MSLARRHRETVLARIAAEQAGQALSAGAAPPMPEDGPAATEYQQLLARLHDDLRTLHGIQSREAKAAKKAELILSYLPWCEGALAIEEGQAAPQDEIVITCLIWALDTRNWLLALDLGDHVIGHGLQLPERFHRGPAALIVSEVADAALTDPGTLPHDILERAAALAEPPHDMKDETRARIHRALGESWSRQADTFDPTAETAFAGGKPALIDAALIHMRRAMQLDAKVGVKKPIEQLEREAKKLAEAAAADTN